jgi:dipeptidyl aminopeptidase/acylaminoacyl peptidase
MRTAIFVLFAFVFSVSSFAQKKPLTLADFDQWKSISGATITKDGAYIYWESNPQDGDGTLFLYNTKTKQTKSFERGDNARVSPDGQFFVFSVKPKYTETREAKRKKKKKDEMPKPHLVIYNLANSEADTIKNIESFTRPAKEGNWLSVVIKVEEEPEATDSTEVENEDLLADKEDGKKKKKKAKKKELVRLLSLDGSKSAEFEKVKDTYFPEYATQFFFVREERDSLHPKGLYSVALEADLNPVLIDSTFEDITNISLNKRGTSLVYYTTQDSAEADIRYYAVNMWDGTELRTLLDTATAGLGDGLMPASGFRPVIDENGRYVMLGVKPIPTIYPEDTMALDEEKVKLDIWSHTDEYIQPYQKENKKLFENRAFVARIDLNDNSFLQLSDEAMRVNSMPRDTLGTWLTAYDDKQYRKELSYITPTHKDLYLIHIETGERKAVAKKTRGTLRLSPDEGYAYWYDRADRHYYAYNTVTGERVNLSASIDYPIWDEENDVPDDPYPYGVEGWLGDSIIVINDRYDLWGVNPAKPDQPINYTKGMGRKNEMEFDLEGLGNYRKRLPKKEWVLSAFNKKTKDEGFYKLNLITGEMTVLVEPEPYMYYDVRKAEESDELFVRKSRFVEYPEIAVTDKSFSNPQVISNTNPQQAEYNWGTVELVEWKGYNKKKLQGLLYKPEDFDPNKKYPMVVYFYETYSDRLHNYTSPSPSASTVNFAHYVSNGYLVFVPDIVYKVGEPGPSAYDCVVSGAKNLAKEPWVDETRMGIQGQSWGGYQVAYLVTQTDLFTCGMAGAPVSNMTSAYGGIRWGSGMSREFQYERTQSRLGATLWEDRDAYIKNSPVFFADQVNTPLMMMHNDNDGAVPWYQGIEYFMALRRLDKPVWMLVYNGEAHNLRKRHNRKDLTIRMMQFFDHYLKDAPAPEWMVEGRDAVEKEDNPALELIDE